jgi:perosamine synthetase
MTPIVHKFLQSSPDDAPRLLAALAAGQLSGTADIVAEYETQLSATFSSTYAIAVASGSAALQTALHVLGDGTEVLVPSDGAAAICISHHGRRLCSGAGGCTPGLPGFRSG